MSEMKQGAPRHNPWIKMAIEIGPLLIFFFANSQYGLFAATAAFMIAMVISLAASYAILRHIAVLPLVTSVFVLVFGGLTLYLHDEMFIKMKPTVVNMLFAIILFGGLAFGKSFLKSVFDSVFEVDDEGWRKLTFRWACFFVLLAVLNETVWRTMSTDAWVNFKVFGIMPLTFVFSLFQLRLLNRHKLPEAEGAESP